MAKFVIAAHSDCPYYARAELLGDRLARSLQHFHLHKIMIQPSKWQEWLDQTCKEKGWQFKKSPIVWRELIDRGGKGVLIGDANQFQEYVKAYYDIESDFNSFDMRTIAGENKVTKDALDQEDRDCRALSKPVHVAVTNAACAAAYHLLDTLTSGEVLGPNVEMTLRLLVNSEEEMSLVQGNAMEAEDLGNKLLRGVKICTSPHVAFENCSYVIMLDEFVQGKDESTRDWLKRNSDHYGRMGNIINHKALNSCKVLVAGNGPINFNAGNLLREAPSLARQNVVAVATTVENAAKSTVGERLNVNPAGVVDLVVWGNINGSSYADVSHCRVHGHDGAVWGPSWYSVDAVEMIHENKWIVREFPNLVTSRKERVGQSLGKVPSLSASNAVATTLRHWCRGSPKGQVFSLGVHSKGWYETPRNTFFSLPVTFDPKGYWHVNESIELTPQTKEGIEDAIQDLIKEEQIHTGLIAGYIPLPALYPPTHKKPHHSNKKKKGGTSPKTFSPNNASHVKVHSRA